jgi:hypothetical protein
MTYRSSTLPSQLCSTSTLPTQFRGNMFRDSNCLQSLVFIRWSGWLLAPTTGLVTFSITVGSNSPVSETVKLYVDSRLYIDSMSCSQLSNILSSCFPQASNTAAIIFISGIYHAIDVELLSYSQSPYIRLSWSYSGVSTTLVPSSNLFSQRGTVTPTVLPILNAAFSATTSSLSGPGLSIATCGYPQSFSVTLRDSFSNIMKNTLSSSINVFCRILAVSGSCTDCPSVIPCKLLFNGNTGTGLASYIVTKSGHYNVKVSIAPIIASSAPFAISSSPWSGYLFITSTGYHFFSIVASIVLTSVSITISGQLVSSNFTAIFLNVSLGNAVPIEIGFTSAGGSSVSIFWKEAGKATFVQVSSSSIYGPRTDLSATNTISASSSNMPSPMFSSATLLSTFTAGVVSSVVVTVKDEFANSITLNSFSDSMAFISNTNPSKATSDFVSYTASLLGSNHTFALSFTASGLYKISAKVLENYFLQWRLYGNSVCSGSPLSSGTETSLAYNWGSKSITLNGMSFSPFMNDDGMSVEWTGYFLSRNSGAQTYIDCSGFGGIRIFVNGMISSDAFMIPTNTFFSVRALMKATSAWNFLKIQFRDVSGNASIFCSGFGALGLSYFNVSSGTVSVTNTSLTFSAPQSLPSGTSVYVFAQHQDAWRTATQDGYAQAMPIYKGTLSSACAGVSCVAAEVAVTPITSQNFFFLLPTSTLLVQEINLATKQVYGTLVSIPGFDEFAVVVLPASPCASTSQLSLPSVTIVTTGTVTRYAVRCLDKFSNFCTLCGTSFLFSQGKPYFSVGIWSEGISGFLFSNITLAIPAPIDVASSFSISTIALVTGSLSCTYYSSSSFLNTPLVSGNQFPQVLSTLNPALGLPATFYGTYFTRWEGYLKATSTSLYSIRASSKLAGNEKLRIWINDEILIDYWNVVDTVMNGVFSASSDVLYLFKIEFEASHSNPSKMTLQFARTASIYEDIPTTNLFSAFHVIGSPFFTTVHPIFGNVLSTVTGPGLSIATAGTLSSFTITLKDSLLTATFVNASLACSLFWTASNMRPWSDFPVKLSQSTTGIYKASFNVTRSGIFSLEVLCKSMQKTSTSAANSICNAGVLIPFFTVLVNPGYAGRASVVMYTSNITVGVVQTLSILARDTFGNNIIGDGTSFFRTTVSNGEEIHSVPQFYNSTNKYEVKYRVSASGNYTLVVEALIPGLSKLLISDSLSKTFSSITTSSSSATLDFSDSATFKSTSSSELLYLMRYSGFIRPETTGIHTFWISNPDTSKRHRTWLSDRYIIDSWQATSIATEFSAVVGLVSNSFYELFIDFANSGVSTSINKTLSLQWQYMGNSRIVIPSQRLFQFYQRVSAFSISAFPRSVCASACVLSGVGLSLATSGEASPFSIYMRDEFSNPTTDQQPIFIAQIVGDSTLRHSSKSLRHNHGILQSASDNVITGAYVPFWKKSPPASYYSSSALYQAFRNFNPYSGSQNEAYWPLSYGGLYATAYAGPFEQLIISAAVPNGIHATYFSRMNDNGAIIRVSANTPAAQAIVSVIPAAPGFNAGRFQGFFRPTVQGLYTFRVDKPLSQSTRIWIDGVLIINDWTSPSGSSVSGTLFFSLSPHAPMYSFTLEYDISSLPSLSLLYACNQEALKSIPSSSFFLRFDIPARVKGTSGSLSATYYNSNTCDATKALASVFDGAYFSFSSSSGNSVPVPGAWTTAGTFSARWKGFISPPKNDIFTFFLTKGHSSEYARLFLDDVLALENPLGSTTLVMSQTYLFNHVPKPEQLYSIQVEYGSSNSVTTKKLAVSWSNSGLSTLPFLFSPSSTPRYLNNSVVIPQSLVSESYLSTSMTSFTSDSSYVSTIYPFGSSIGCESSPGMSAFACSTIELRIGTSLSIIVQAGRLCASKSVAFGSCLTIMTSGKTCEFFVVAKDSFGNHRETGKDMVAAVSKSGFASTKFSSTAAASQVQGLHATYYNEENGNSGSAVESVIMFSNIAISKAQASTLSNLKNDFFFSVRFRGFLSFQHSSQNIFPFVVNVGISTSSAIGEFFIVLINQVQSTIPTTINVTSASFRPVLFEVTYRHSSGVSRDIDWKFVFTYAIGGAAAEFTFLPSPIISGSGDISGLYSVYAETLFSTPSTVSVALGESETSSFRICFYVNATLVLPCSVVYVPDLFSGIFKEFMLPDSASSSASIDAVVTGYVLSPCTCPLIITFDTSNLLTLHWDGTIRVNISKISRQYRTTSVKVDGKFGISHFLRAVFTKCTFCNKFGNPKFEITVDPLYRVSFAPVFKFIPLFDVISSNPSTLLVSPGEICSTTSIYWGNGLSVAILNGASNTFSVQCRDLWKNNRTLADADLFMYKLQLVTPVSSYSSLRYTAFSDAGSGIIAASYTYSYTSHSQPPIGLQLFLSQNLRKGLIATYFSDNQLQVPFNSIFDDDFNDAVSRAFPLVGIDTSTLFSARWSGLIRPSASTSELTFTLTVGANAFIALWIDGVSMVNHRNYATVSTSLISTATSTGASNSFYEILIEYSHLNKLSSSWTVNLRINGVLIPKERFIAVEKIQASALVLQVWPIHPTETTTSSVVGSSIMTAGFSSFLTVTVKDQSGTAYPTSFWITSRLVARLIPADDSVAPWPREGDLGWATFPTSDESFKTGMKCYQCPPQVVGSATSNGSPSSFIVSFLPTISGFYYMALSIALVGSLHSTFYGASSSQIITSITNMDAVLSDGTFQTYSRVYNMQSLGLRSKLQNFGHYIGTTDQTAANKFSFGIDLSSGSAGLSGVSSGIYRSLHRISTRVSSSSSGSIDFSRASVSPVTGLSSFAFT